MNFQMYIFRPQEVIQMNHDIKQIFSDETMNAMSFARLFIPILLYLGYFYLRSLTSSCTQIYLHVPV